MGRFWARARLLAASRTSSSILRVVRMGKQYRCGGLMSRCSDDLMLEPEPAATRPTRPTMKLPPSLTLRPKARTCFKAFSLAPKEYRGAARCGTNMKYV